MLTLLDSRGKELANALRKSMKLKHSSADTEFLAPEVVYLSLAVNLIVLFQYTLKVKIMSLINQSRFSEQIPNLP